MTATTHPFDADTALEQLGDGRWRGAITEGWLVIDGAFGGYVIALLLRALVAATADPERPPRSLAVHFLAPPRVGTVELAASVERAGGASTTVALRMEQEGRTVALALAAAARWREGEPEWSDGGPPPAPPPEQCPQLEFARPMPNYFRNFEIRWVDGGAPGNAAARARNVTWVRTAPPRTPDHLLVGMLGDCLVPPAFSRLGRFVRVPTADLTLHFRAPLPAAQDGDEGWLLAVQDSRFAAGGVWESDAELWSPGGVLLAQARQLALLRT